LRLAQVPTRQYITLKVEPTPITEFPYIGDINKIHCPRIRKEEEKAKATLLKTPMYNMFLPAEGAASVGSTDQCIPNPLKQAFQMLVVRYGL
jgi:hypothetical protein